MTTKIRLRTLKLVGYKKRRSRSDDLLPRFPKDAAAQMRLDTVLVCQQLPGDHQIYFRSSLPIGIETPHRIKDRSEII